MINRRRGNRSSSKHRASNRVTRLASNTTHPQFEMLESRWLLSGEPTLDVQEFVDVNESQTVDFVWPGASVVGRRLFYNQSGTASPLRYDGNDAAINDRDDFAIATDKTAYLPGSGAATFANVSSYTKGINGIMVDIQGTHGDIGVDDLSSTAATTTRKLSGRLHHLRVQCRCVQERGYRVRTELNLSGATMR